MDFNLFFLAKVGFLLLTCVFYPLLLRQIFNGVSHTNWPEKKRRQFKRMTVVTLAAWFCFVSWWSLSGMMADFTRFPLNLLPVLLIPLILSLAWTFSRATGDILRHVKASDLIRLQSFRFFVEILLWVLFLAHLIPVQMTFEGLNFDILVGLSAPVIGWLIGQKKISRIGLIVWNIAGLALLVNIVTIAILSTPSPLRVFMNEPANRVVAIFPVSLLPAFLVPLAYTLHFLSLRQIFQDKNAS